MDERSRAMVERAGRVMPSLLLALAASPAWAHPGHGAGGLPTGLLHPITGVDHLLATFGVGLLAGHLAARYANRSSPGGGRPPRAGARAIVATVGFATAAGLLLGALLATLSGASGALHGGTAVELAASCSLLVVAALLLAGERLAIAPMAAVVALVALPHGFLHGLEGAGAPFFAGLGLASGLLFAAGALVSRRLVPALAAGVRGAVVPTLALALAACSAGLLALQL